MYRLLRIGKLLLIFSFNYPYPSSAQTFTGTPAKEWINTIVERFQLSGYAQGGYEYYDQSTTEDQFKISRIIFMANAKVSDHINAFMMYDSRVLRCTNFGLTTNSARLFRSKWDNSKLHSALRIHFHPPCWNLSTPAHWLQVI